MKRLMKAVEFADGEILASPRKSVLKHALKTQDYKSISTGAPIVRYFKYMDEWEDRKE